ncbi:MAG TPA: adenosylcobinamide-GDP ribazoletransferase [Candidatus Methylomirabilis sp.]|nr:adenosylcobinamide-GDP ribazoletransferase [Candidatus Methylomirabilis sp.]
MIRSLILAVRFLTIVPVPGRQSDGPGAFGRAAWWFPIVGFALGTFLVAMDRAVQALFSPILSALLVLSVWKVATGGIHLDGLADCLDGLGGRDPQHRLAIMRDSRIGTFGAIGLILYFLIALFALAEIPTGTRGRVLLLAPTVGRLAPLVIGPRWSAASPDHGSGAAFLGSVSQWAGPTHLVFVSVLSVWLLGRWGPVVALGSLVAVSVWSAFLVHRFGGLTGDVLGSGIELGELGILLAGAVLAPRGLV